MKILCVRPLSDQQLQRLREVQPGKIDTVSMSELEAAPEKIREIEVVYGSGRVDYTEATSLKWIHTTGAGVEWLLTPLILERRPLVTNSSGVHAEAITEHLFAMLLRHARRLEDARRAQLAGHWDPTLIRDGLIILSGLTIAILGVGSIGGHMARVAQAFGMKVLGCRRTNQPHPNVDEMFPFSEKISMLRRADVVVNLLPLTPLTRHFIGREELAAMKPDAILMNAGRGKTIDTDALVETLAAGKLQAVMLDVTDPEPLPDGHPLWGFANVSLTFHYAGIQPKFGERQFDLFCENLERYMADQPLQNMVDLDEGY